MDHLTPGQEAIMDAVPLTRRIKPEICLLGRILMVKNGDLCIICDSSDRLIFPGFYKMVLSGACLW